MDLAHILVLRENNRVIAMVHHVRRRTTVAARRSECTAVATKLRRRLHITTTRRRIMDKVVLQRHIDQHLLKATVEELRAAHSASTAAQ